jgi:hypothetical protein
MEAGDSEEVKMAVKSVESSDSQSIQEQQRMMEDQRRNEMSEADKKEFMSFMEQVRSQYESGSLDTAALAETAPESFKKAVEARGVDLETAIQNLASRKPPSGPPPAGASGGEVEGSADVESIYSNVADESVSSVNTLKAMEAGISEADDDSTAGKADDTDYNALLDDLLSELEEGRTKA